MKIVKLLDRQGVQVTPQTHIDSVMNSEGQVLDELYAPLTHVGSYGDDQHKVVDEDGAGFMSPEQLNRLENAATDAFAQINSDDTEIPAEGWDTITFYSGHNITLRASVTEDEKSITINHDTVDVETTSRGVQSEPGDNFLIEENYELDDMGHTISRERLNLIMPITSRINTLLTDSGVIYLGGTNAVGGNQSVYATESLSYDPSTNILSAPIIDSNLVGGDTGSIPYQAAANVTTLLSIGTEGQILKVSANSTPYWENDKGVVSVSWTDGTASGPTGTITLVDNSTVSIPAIPSASSTTSGVVTTGVQTFAGQKTFDTPIVGSISDLTGGAKGSLPYQIDTNDTTFLPIGTEGHILGVSSGVPVWKADKGVVSYNWTQGTTLGPILNTVLVDGTTVSAPSVPSASSSTSGVITTGEQLISGNKQFLGNVSVDGNFTVAGDMFATQQNDLLISDKRITLAYTDLPSTATANGAGIEICTYADSDEEDSAQKYHGPSWVWYSDVGWTATNTDPVSARSLDVNLAGADAVYRINGIQVLSMTQYIGNSATADKVNHKITWFDGTTFDGSTDVYVNYDTTGAAVKDHASTTTEFGAASTSEYGHVKISDGLVVSTGVISADYGTSATELAAVQSPGTSTQLSRADHVHPYPSLNDLYDTLEVSKGGTGRTNVTENALLYGQGTSAMAETNVGTENQALLADANGVPTFTTLVMSHISDSGDVPRISDTGYTCDDFIA